MIRPCANPKCSEHVGLSSRPHAKYCSARCRAEASRARRPKTGSGPTKKRTQAHSANATKPRGRPGKRADTLYAVLIEDDKLRKRWRELGTLAANKRGRAESRMREIHNYSDDVVLRAVPITSLYPASR